MTGVPTSRPILRRLFYELRPEWPFLGAALGTQVLTSATALAVPFVTGKLVDASYGKETAVAEFVSSHPVAACGAAIGFFTVTGAANLARATLTNVAGERFALRLRSSMVHGAGSRETGFLGGGRISAGDLQTRIVGDVAVVQKATTSSLKLLRSLLMLTGGIPYLIYISPTLSIGSLVLLPPMAFAARTFGTTMKAQQNLVQKALSDASGAAGEFANNFKLIRQYGGEKAELDRFDSHAKTAAARAVEASTLSALFDFAVDGLAQAIVVAVVAVGLYQVRMGYMTPGALSQFVMLSLMVANHSWSLSSNYTKLMRGAAAAERVFSLSEPSKEESSFVTLVPGPVGRPALAKESYLLFPNRPFSPSFNRFVGIDRVYKDTLFEDPPKVDTREAFPKHQLIKRSHLEFKDVTFSYDKVTVLTGLSMGIDVGETVAIVGSSGSGKSTLSALATRLYDPSHGVVLFEGRDVKIVPDLRHRLAVVDQDHILLHGSIEENVLYGCRNASKLDLEEALRVACASEFVEAKGLGYPVGGGGLSGGQRQRIAIARAILKVLSLPNCNMIFLDEGLSNLDRFTGERTWENICELSSSRKLTLVHVTHQQVADLLGSVDRVVKLDQGKVIEERLGQRRR